MLSHFGKNVTAAAPGSAQGLYLIVSDIEAARKELIRRGVEVSEVFHGAGNVYAGRDEPYLFGRIRVKGPDAEHGSYRSFASFRDPDGNGWLLQEVTTRLPGRIDPATTTFASASDLASALRRAEAAHGEHEKRTGKRDENWPDWYAAYMVAEQAGTELQAAMRAANTASPRTARTGTPPGQTGWGSAATPAMGLETARRARDEGAKLIPTGRNPERLQRAASELAALSAAAFDASDPDSLERFFRDLQASGWG